MRRILVSAAALGGSLVVASGAARAQTSDFATCSADLVACDSDTQDCCYRAFDPVASDRAIIIPLPCRPA